MLFQLSLLHTKISRLITSFCFFSGIQDCYLKSLIFFLRGLISLEITLIFFYARALLEELYNNIFSEHRKT